MANQKLKIFFLGSAFIAVPSLAALLEDDTVEICGVGTQPDKKAGRGNKMTPTPVGKYAVKAGLNPWKINNINNPEYVEALKKLNPDFIVVIAFGQLLKEEILNLPVYECINVHASILPKYRGASPIAAALLNNDPESGVSIMKMEKGLDTGPVYEVFKVTIDSTDNARTLEEKLAMAAAANLSGALKRIAKGAQPLVQDDNNACYCRKISKSDAHLDWNESASTLRGKIHAYFPWPGAYFFLDTGKGQKRMTVVSAGICEQNSDAPPGTILDGGKNRWLVSCGSKDVIEILEIKPEGKRLMAAGDFLRGTRLTAGDNLSEL